MEEVIEVKIGSETIEYGNSGVEIAVTEFNDTKCKLSWLCVEINTSSYGDHSSNIKFSLDYKNADQLRKMGELLILGARKLVK